MDSGASTIVTLLLNKKNKKKRKRSVWVKPWLGRRINLRLYETLVQELRFEDESASIKDSVLIFFAMVKKFCEI